MIPMSFYQKDLTLERSFMQNWAKILIKLDLNLTRRLSGFEILNNATLIVLLLSEFF